jgi:hypothetical protein
MKITKCAKVIGGAALLASSLSASAGGLDFFINEQVVPNVPNVPFAVPPVFWQKAGETSLKVNEMGGSYVELFTGTPTSATTGTFVTKAFATIGQFYVGNTELIGPATGTGAIVPAGQRTFLDGSDGSGGVGDGANYRLYGLFEASGTYTVGAGGTVSFTGSGGDISLWLDEQRDTEATTGFLNGSVAGGAGASWAALLADSTPADDVKLASSNSLVFGIGQTKLGFDLLFNGLSLTTTGSPNGDVYFVSPRPFHTAVKLDGSFNDFTPAGTSVLNGLVSITFQAVPEPATIGLLGLACVVGGVTSRRRRAVA